jgi:hypothetical protein
VGLTLTRLGGFKMNDWSWIPAINKDRNESWLLSSAVQIFRYAYINKALALLIFSYFAAGELCGLKV